MTMIHADATGFGLRRAVGALAQGALRRVAAMRAAAERREMIRALGQLDESLLDDIGLTRNDVDRLIRSEGAA